MSPKFLCALVAVAAACLTAPAQAATFTVDDPAGDPATAAATPGTLGWAIHQANSNGEPDRIEFAVPASGPVIIMAEGEYVLTETGTVIDGFTQPGATPNAISAPGPLDTVLTVTVDGSLIPPGCQGPPPGDFCRGTVFRIETDGVTIRGLNVHSGPLYEIGVCLASITCVDNRVQGCFLGTDIGGQMALPSGTWGPYNPPQIIGVYITGRSSGNVIGSDDDDLDEAAERNLISGEWRDLVFGDDFLTGIGVLIAGGAGMPTANAVRGNLIGTDASASSALPSNRGVALASGASNNTIEDNVIAGNLLDGLWSWSHGATNLGNIVERNFVGMVPSSPDLALGNGGSGLYLGPGTSATAVGNGDLLRANVISDNGASGVLVEGDDFADSTQNQILGNIIGLDASAAGAMGNAESGVLIRNSAGPNSIGNTGIGNIISGNDADGVSLHQASGVLVADNHIGLNQVGDSAVPNGAHGVLVELGSACVIASNSVAHNGLDGVYVLGSSPHIVENALWQNQAWGLLTNIHPGVDYAFSPADDTISAPLVSGNTVTGNLAGGVYFHDSAPANRDTVVADNTLEDNNGQTRLLQHWRAAIEVLDGSGTPVGGSAYTIQIIGSSGQLQVTDFSDSSGSFPLWGPTGFGATDYWSWFDVEEYRVDAAGVQQPGDAYTVVASGPTAGLVTWTFDGRDNDAASTAGWPNGVASGGQFRYQVAEVPTEADTDSDGVGDSDDCAPEDPGYDGVLGAACDLDGDGYCDASISGPVHQWACAAECGNPTCTASDCDDADAAVSPAGSEGPASAANCADGADNDCDGDLDGLDSDCACGSDAECDDGDPCDGVESCVSGVCAPGTAVDCAHLTDACNLGACDPGSGACQALPANEGGACDDADACTMDTTCTAGACGAGLPTDADGDGAVSDACGGDDCDDADASVNPAAAEVCNDTADNDCDGLIDLADGDCAVCGDGVLSAGEGCDDNGVAAGDGCSGSCAVEPGWACRQVSGLSWCGTAAGTGDLVITEISQNPNCVDDAAGEWFEIRNQTSGAIHMRGFRLRDLGSDDTILDGLVVAGGAYAVLCRNADPTTNGGITCDLEVSGTLGNSDDELILENPADGLVDQVAWDGGPEFPDPTGASMSLTPGSDATSNDDGANWCPAIDPIGGACADLGTPGAANPVCPGACNDDDADGYSSDSCGGTDCNDSDASIHPGAAEICGDDLDQDCSGSDLQCGCADDDGDGFFALACGGLDCDDTQAGINPAAVEVCDDGADNDCNGAVDLADAACAVAGCGDGALEDGEACDDANLTAGDGCGLDCQVESGWSCRAGEPSLCGHSGQVGDLVVTEIMQNPSCATDAQGEWIEIHNVSGVDLNLRAWRLSDDGGDNSIITDLLVSAGAYVVFCRNLDPASNGNVDCDAQFTGSLGNTDDEVIISDPTDHVIDRVAYDGGVEFPSPTGATMSLNPGADDLDNDLGSRWCEAVDAIPSTCDPQDLGTPGSVNPPCGIACWDDDGDGAFDVACGGDDCDDTDATVYPLAEEICDDGVDQDCSGQDLGCGCPDLDGDGYLDQACGGVDCDDDAPAVHPDATEVCDDAIDNDCDAMVDMDDPWCQCVDADADGHQDVACGGDDCDDANLAVNPEANEICDDSLDNDCDGDVDADDDDCAVTCPDLDEDGYQDAACGGDDCDDDDASVNPGATEGCDDSVDNDCDGDVDLSDSDCDQPCPDLDGDGFESAACGGVDCDDSDDTIYLGAIEHCDDGADNDCDGLVDRDDGDCPAKKASDCGCATPADGSALGLLFFGLIWFARRRR